jgi:hypothetical protein
MRASTSTLTDAFLDSRLFYMGTILISALAIACILTAIETFYKPIGKWRGLVALLFAILFDITLGTRLLHLPIYILATTFVGLTISLMVDQLFVGTNDRDMRNLPKRIPSR